MHYGIPSLKDAPDCSGKRVFLAIDLNVPIQGERVIDDYRIRRSAKTLEFLRSHGARTLLVAHRTEESASLAPVFEYLKQSLPVTFAATISDARAAIERAQKGEFVLLENIRKIEGKREKENDQTFAKELASLADIYVNETFSVSHREHASIVGVPRFIPGYAGFLFCEEIENLSRAFGPRKPFVFILAGAKFETKFPLVKKFLKTASSVFIGGALANDLFKAKGCEIGKSRHSEGNTDFTEILESDSLILPEDLIVENTGGRFVKTLKEVGANDYIFDAGPKTIEALREKLKTAKFVLWNGTLGVYEKGFEEGTEALARAIAESGVESIVGGGDTLACISKLGLMDKFSFVSTGGGAMLDFLANETLPGIQALQKN